MTLEEFFEKIEKLKSNKKGCLIWKGDLYKGYAVYSKNLTHRCNRAVLEKKLGRKIAEGMGALHTCDDRACVNKDHLYEGTQKQNMQDMVDRGRSLKGKNHPYWRHPDSWAWKEDHPLRLHPDRIIRGSQHHFAKVIRKGQDHYNVKLTEKQVVEIRSQYQAGGVTYTELGNLYGVSKPTIGDIVRRTKWKHI